MKGKQSGTQLKTMLASAVRKSVCSFKNSRLNVCSLCSAAGKNIQDFYDITIVGGGMVGASLACALGLEKSLDGHKILLLEAAPNKTQDINSTYSNRVSNITPGSKNLLESIGTWDHICSTRCKPFQRMQVWDACSDAYISFDPSKEFGNSSLDIGYIVENPVTIAALQKQLEELDSRVNIFYGTKLKNLILPSIARDLDAEEVNHPWAKLELENGTTLHSRLVVGADGPQSLVRKQAKMDYLSWNYDQSGVVATLQLEEVFHETVYFMVLPNFKWEDFERNPLVDQATRTTHLLASVLQQWTKADLGPQSPPNVSGVEKGSRAMFPYGFGHATEYVRPRLALIGDAAHRVHPLAGQGVNLGFGDVACLRDVLSEAAKEGRDIGGLEHLLTYETRRQQSVVPMITAIDFLKRLYSTSNPLPVLARTVGLIATNTLAPLKEQIVGFAMR
ncbi:PREDICTED: ubiquinone biosynthesis monooxygenase COQ6, mitochondrial-like [Acropora digitifera]|uniref:ubiquinone biosynthesis monooxygenase COQ6, mitochondrial-like n=1 Tax=Acropora digitifera TaxID=70779 RepID=UPI00077A2C37|nr:PREDICTED: ubiquinone biosynthesis monooxygenase COQ6, mitochondrial-like [Acropora digitifera]